MESNLFSFEYNKYPPQEKYPLNLQASYGDRVAQNELLEDLKCSSNYLIVTAFTSIEYLLDTYSKITFQENQISRILLGYEPIIRGNRKVWYYKKLEDEIISHWLENGISITCCGAVIHMLDLIQKKKVTFKFYDNLHAKLYVGDYYAMLGSSNFSYSGLKKNREANIRFRSESLEYNEIRQIAENYYEAGTTFNKQIESLLNKLLKIVTWQEALARAVSDLLEGNWLNEYPNFRNLEKTYLWQSQKQAIGQALYILDNQGSALIADPTGSGKTRLGAFIHLSLINRFWAQGFGSKTKTTIICPPVVTSIWSDEYTEFGIDPPSLISHGLLSSVKSEIAREKALSRIKDSKILMIDEAHNFLNKTSARSISILNNLADHILLLTATPINRKAEDLLRLVELLDIDNLSDEAIVKYKSLVLKKTLLSKTEQESLKELISAFTVRRTKKELNKQIEKNPGEYLNRQGHNCKFPEQKHKKYKTGETKVDRAIVTEINQLIGQLKGIIYLRDIRYLETANFTDDEGNLYLEKRLKMASAICRYNLQAMLRSSKTAVIEHILGTKYALDKSGIKKSTKSETGNVINKLDKYAFTLPKANYKVSVDWLNNLILYSNVCANEIRVYKKIVEKVEKLSDSREIKKVEFIYKLLKKHNLMITYDSRSISLDFLNKLFEEKYPDRKSMVVKGTDTGNKKKLQDLFKLGSTETGMVAFCSDSMSEGVNLQQASAVLFLDMPSVIRIAEQRIGRLDRLDSPHPEIEIYWPDDSKEYALKTDKRFLRTLTLVENIIGSNIDLPVEFYEGIEEIYASVMIKEFKDYQKEEKWEGIKDAFQSVRELVTGEFSLITEDEYEIIKNTNAQVKSKVSLVESNKNWVFFAVKGTKFQSPKWYFFEENAKPVIDLNVICKKMTSFLYQKVLDQEWTNETDRVLASYVEKLNKFQLDFLPNKKKRALTLFKETLETYSNNPDLPTEAKKVIRHLLSVLKVTSTESELFIDYYQLAQNWLDVIQPLLIEKKKNNKSRRNIISLNSLKKDLKQNPLEYRVLDNLLQNLPIMDKIENRISACILGVKNQDDQ